MQMSGNSDAIREARLTAQDISERFRTAEQWARVKTLRLLPGSRDLAVTAWRKPHWGLHVFAGAESCPIADCAAERKLSLRNRGDTLSIPAKEAFFRE